MRAHCSQGQVCHLEPGDSDTKSHREEAEGLLKHSGTTRAPPAPRQANKVPTTATQTQVGGIRSPRWSCVPLGLSPQKVKKDFHGPAVAGKGAISSQQPQFPASHFCVWLRKTQMLINNLWAGDHCHSSITASLAHPHTLPQHLGLVATAQLDTTLPLSPLIVGVRRANRTRRGGNSSISTAARGVSPAKPAAVASHNHHLPAPSISLQLSQYSPGQRGHISPGSHPKVSLAKGF